MITALALVACSANPPPAAVTPTAPDVVATAAPPPEPGAVDREPLQRAVAAAVIAHDQDALRRLVVPDDVLAGLCAGDASPIARALEAATAVEAGGLEGVVSRLDTLGASQPQDLAAGEVLQGPGGATCQLTRPVQVTGCNIGIEHRRGDAKVVGELDTRAILVDGRWYLFTDVPLHELARTDAGALEDEPEADCIAFAGRVELLRGREPTLESLDLCEQHDLAYLECARHMPNEGWLDACARPADDQECGWIVEHLVELAPDEDRDELRAMFDASPELCEGATHATWQCTAFASTFDAALACFDPIP